MRKHLVIPDTQIRPDSPTDMLAWVGEYIVEKKPEVIVQLGDFADMESLCFYDEGKIGFEGRRYKEDLKASKNAMDTLCEPMIDYNKRQRKSKQKMYQPEMYLTLGNHENRINRMVENDPKMDGMHGVFELGYEEYGWNVIPFLEPKEIDGVTYCHYFTYELTNNPISGTMQNRLNKIGFSFIAGHQQIYKVGTKSLINGKVIRGLVQGAFYIEDEEYRGPQSNNEKRSIFLLHEVKDGDYSLMEISLDYLCRRYEKMPIWMFVKKKYPKIYEKSTWMKYQEKNYGGK